MRNHAPIFVNGFSRGGTTILTNLIASHPEVCLIGETHHAFKGHSITDSLWGVVRKCLYHDAPILARHCQDFFSPRLVAPRKRLSRWAQKRIDSVFYREKIRSRHPILNRYKAPETEYATDEIISSRLLCKNIDGMIFATDEFADMYEDATFFGLVRNGLAVCEGHLRRGRSAKEIGRRYQVLVDKMFYDAERHPRYELMRFEDIVTRPTETLNRIFMHCSMDVNQVQQIRMQVRRVMDAEGNHRLRGGSEWDVVWLDPTDLENYFESDVDSNQVRQLSSEDRDAFLREAGRAMEKLGYDTATTENSPVIYKMSDYQQQNASRRKAA